MSPSVRWWKGLGARNPSCPHTHVERRRGKSTGSGRKFRVDLGTQAYHRDVRPTLDDLLDRVHVVALPMRVRFRGITQREMALIDGPAGWGEFGAFLEYGPAEAAHWLACGRRIRLTAQQPPIRRRPHPDQRHRPGGARRAGARRARPVPGRAYRQGQGRRAGSDAGRRRRPGQRRARAGSGGAGGRQRRLEPGGGGRRGARADRRRAAGVPGAAVRRASPNWPNCAVASRCRWPPTRASARPTIRCTWSRAGGRRHRGAESRPAGRGLGRCCASPSRSTSPSWCPAPWTRRSASGSDWSPLPRCRTCTTPAGWAPAGLFVDDVTEPVMPVDGYLPAGRRSPIRREWPRCAQRGA